MAATFWSQTKLGRFVHQNGKNLGPGRGLSLAQWSIGPAITIHHARPSWHQEKWAENVARAVKRPFPAKFPAPAHFAPKKHQDSILFTEATLQGDPTPKIAQDCSVFGAATAKKKVGTWGSFGGPHRITFWRRYLGKCT